VRRTLRWKLRLRAVWYRWRYGIETQGLNQTIMPFTGRGTFVDVLRKGPFYDVIYHHGAKPGVRHGTLRLIPAQYNHGFMVELWQDGRLRGRAVLSYADLYRQFDATAEVRDAVKVVGQTGGP